MSEEAAPERIGVVWSPEARADVRAIEREIAMQILYCIDRYLISRTGDVKKLRPPLTGSDCGVATTVCSSISRKRTSSRLPASRIARKPTGELEGVT